MQIIAWAIALLFGDTYAGLIAAILTLTAFEVHRAGMNCRVDMLNTANGHQYQRYGRRQA